MPSSNQQDALQAWIKTREAEYAQMKRGAVDEALNSLSLSENQGYLKILGVLSDLYDAGFSAGYAQMMEQS